MKVADFNWTVVSDTYLDVLLEDISEDVVLVFFFFQHMVQNQMTPTYTYPQATTLEEYHQVVASQAAAGSAAAAAAGLASIQNVGVAVSAITSEPSGQTIYTTTPVTTNGAADQQLVSFYFLSWLICM